VTVLGTDSSGTHFYWDDSRGERHFGVISDLTTFKIARQGRITVTIPALILTAVGLQTISPALPDSNLDNWRILLGPHTTGEAFMASAVLQSTSQIAVRVAKGPGEFGVASLIAGQTDDANPTTPHSHTLTDGTVIVSTTLGDSLGFDNDYIVDWIIIHI